MIEKQCLQQKDCLHQHILLSSAINAEVIVLNLNLVEAVSWRAIT